MAANREQKQTPAELSASLREQAFALPPEQVLPDGSHGGARIWGLIMETGYPNGVASLVTFIDGSTSMYFSSGGGVIGAGQHDEVRYASKAFIAAANTYMSDFSPVARHPLPDAGRVRFYVRTLDGLKCGEAAERDLGEGRHRLSPLFHAGHRVIAHLRQISEGQKK
jgi:hypothetical protein